MVFPRIPLGIYPRTPLVVPLEILAGTPPIIFEAIRSTSIVVTSLWILPEIHRVMFFQGFHQNSSKDPSRNLSSYAYWKSSSIPLRISAEIDPGMLLGLLRAFCGGNPARSLAEFLQAILAVIL